MNHTYSANGVVTDRLTDQGLHLEFRNTDVELAMSCLMSVTGCFAVLLFLQASIPEAGAQRFIEILACIVGFLALTACFTGFYTKAADNLRLPTKENSVAPHDHVGGLGAAVIFLIGLFVFGAAYAGQRLNGHIVIPEWMGIGIVGLFAAVFAWMFLFSRLVELTNLRGARQFLERLFAFLIPVGKFISSVDSWLVFVVAPAVGATLQLAVVRYAVLFAHIVVGCIFAWFASAPFGLVGAIWAFVAVISVARRWSWIETERNRIIQDPDVPPEQLRIGLEDDLRDEAISSLLLLVLILPIAMRQFHMLDLTHPVFSVTPGSANRLDAWVGFFGVELLKALPFLDWADIYEADAATRIDTSTPLSMHVLLVARAIIDLVFIGAIFQALSISVSLAKNRNDFLNRRSGVDLLDQRIEARELTRLAYKSKGQWCFRDEIEQYTHYNPARLARLKVCAKKGSRLFVAVAELTHRSGQKVVPPAELLPQVTAAKHPSSAEIRSVLDEVDDLKQYDLDYLAIARRQMNWKRGLEAERKRLVQMIVSKVEVTPDREQELADILVGSDADSLANIRVLVVQSLARNAQSNPQNIVPLSQALHHDRANVVRTAVATVMRRLRIEPLSEVEMTLNVIKEQIAG